MFDVKEQIFEMVSSQRAKEIGAKCVVTSEDGRVNETFNQFVVIGFREGEGSGMLLGFCSLLEMITAATILLSLLEELLGIKSKRAYGSSE